MTNTLNTATATYAVRFRLRDAVVYSHLPSAQQVETRVAILPGTIDSVAKYIHSLRNSNGRLAFRCVTINLVNGTDRDWDRQMDRDVACGRMIPWMGGSTRRSS